MLYRLYVAATVVLIATTAQGLADECVIADPADTSLNVRTKPNGEVVNRLRNGREVTIEHYQNDSKGRPWGYATGYYKGEFRRWGWVFMQSVNCGDNQQAALQQNASNSEVCRIADPTDTSLNVRATPNGEVVNRLRNGREVTIERYQNDAKGRPWGFATGYFKGEFRRWGWVFMQGVDCGGTSSTNTVRSASKSSKYPLFMDGSRDLKPFGIHIAYYDRPETQVQPFARECFYYGDGGYSMTLSNDTIQAFARSGFNFEEACAGLRIDNLRYDPENGRRLPTYKIGNTVEILAGNLEPGVVSEELPLVLPACFADARMIHKPGDHRLYTSCDFRFDPQTGRKLSEQQRIELANASYHFILDGAAGPSGDIASAKVLVDKKRRNTKADVDAVLKQR